MIYSLLLSSCLQWIMKHFGKPESFFSYWRWFNCGRKSSPYSSPWGQELDEGPSCDDQNWGLGKCFQKCLSWLNLDMPYWGIASDWNEVLLVFQMRVTSHEDCLLDVARCWCKFMSSSGKGFSHGPTALHEIRQVTFDKQETYFGCS